MVELPFKKMVDIMLSAYPCCNFDNAKQYHSDHLVNASATNCSQAKWAPQEGHVPRGFLGATSTAKDVKVVFVFAEPGHPHKDESYEASSSPFELLTQSLNHTYKSMKNGTDPIHKNVRLLLNELFPDLEFDDQLRHVWMTESRLCSLKRKVGDKALMLRKPCAELHLTRQLNVLPNAKIIAFGIGKAVKCLQKLPIDFIKAEALSKPAANTQKAQESWIKAIETVRSVSN